MPRRPATVVKAAAPTATFRGARLVGADLEFARQASVRASGYALGTADGVPHLFVEF